MKANTGFYGLIAALLAGILLACVQSAQTFSDEEISLRKADPLTTTDAPKLVYMGKDPGENKKLKRAFYGAPPMIPHSVVDQEVSSDSNDCLDCHGEADEDTPGLPTSHKIKPLFKIWQRDQAKNGMVTTLVGYGRAEVVSGTRYNCMLCHAPQAADTPQLVDNAFVPQDPGRVDKDVLDQLNSVGDY